MFARQRIALSAATIAAATAIAIGQMSPAPQVPPTADTPNWPAGQQPAPQQQQGAPATAPQLGKGELDQLLAPVALYPDALLSQVLMASTYPLEVVQAHRWIESTPNLQGEQLADALAQQPWDPSVKSLINTPTVLQLMDDKLEWTVQLGDAFLAQQGDVMDSVQRLRAQAQQAGQLQSDAQQTVTVAAPPAVYDNGQPQSTTPYVTIEDTSPDVVYVPVYDPGIVYGVWAYPTYPPFFWFPRNYVRTRGFWYDPCRVGPAWGYAWGRPDWRVRRIDLDEHRNAHFNDRLDRDVVVQTIRTRDHNFETNHDVWEHSASHRLGVSYRDPTVAQRFNGRSTADDVRAREAYRGRPDAQAIRAAADRHEQRAPAPVIPNAAAPNAHRDDNVKQDRGTNAPTPERRVPEQKQVTPQQDNKDAAPEKRGSTPTPPSRNETPHTDTPQRSRGGAFNDSNGNGGEARSDSARGAESRHQAEPAPQAAPRQAAPTPQPAPSAPRSEPTPSRGDSGGGGRSSGGGGDGGGGHSGRR